MPWSDNANGCFQEQVLSLRTPLHICALVHMSEHHSWTQSACVHTHALKNIRSHRISSAALRVRPPSTGPHNRYTRPHPFRCICLLYMHTYAHACIRVQTGACRCAHSCDLKRAHACGFACVHNVQFLILSQYTFVCYIDIKACVFASGSTHVCTHNPTHACAHVHAHTCLFVCTCVYEMCICVHAQENVPALLPQCTRAIFMGRWCIIVPCTPTGAPLELA